MPTEGWTPILLVCAHPDDETIGAGIRMSRWDPTRLMILHLTDGSPMNLGDARAAGFQTREEYAHTRRRELYAALDLLGIRPDQCINFKYPDQETWLNLVELTDRLLSLIHELKPGAIYTHPYEGGHPDHDSAAFAVSHAAECDRFEFTSYHEGPSGLVTGQFLNEGEAEVIEPTPEERDRKQKMLTCFRSQERVLKDFPVKGEKFRPAPAYDFSEPPHPGTLHYETLGWNITGEQWRAKAAEARELLVTRSAI